MPEIPFNFLNRRSKTSGFRPTDLQDGQIYIQQADEAILFKNDLGSLVCVSAKTGSFVTSGQTGTLSWSGHTHSEYVNTGSTGNFVTTSQTGVFALAAGTGNFVTTSQTGNFASLNGSNYLCSTQIPNITGDVCINAGTNNSVVYQIQGYPVANTPPSNGQTLQFNGSSWVPGDVAAGGNGGGGLVYYFNDTVVADSPTGNLPSSLSGSFELGRSGMVTQKLITTPILSEVSYDPIVGFVTDVLDPAVNAIPAGLFDFNIWASSNTTTQTILQLKVYKYDGTTSPTLLATSDDVYTYDGAVISQYILSVVLPQTTISGTDRLFILISAKALSNNKNITLYFGGNTPSHVHTTIPAVGGSGLVKVINGIMQSSASALVDADVSASAAIAGTKIQTNYFALASATGAFVSTGQTGAFAASGHTHAQYVTTGSTGAFVTTGQTGVFALAANTGGFVTTGQTGSFGGGSSTVLVSTATGTGYSISSLDYNTIIRYSGSSITNSGLFTIPNNISNFQVGGSVLIAQVSSGQAYFTGAAGTTLLINGSKSRTSARGATVTLTYLATNEWLINGDIV